MTDGLRKSHLRKAPQVGLSEVGLPDIYPIFHVFCNYDVVSVFLALASLAPTLLSRLVSDIFRFSTI